MHIGRVYACSRTTPFLARDPSSFNPAESPLFQGTSFTPGHYYVVFSYINDFLVGQPISSARTIRISGRDAVEAQKKRGAASTREDIKLVLNKKAQQVNQQLLLLLLCSSLHPLYKRENQIYCYWLN